MTKDNPEKGHGGPRDPSVLHTVDDATGCLDPLEIVKAGQVNRHVETEGERVTIDTLARAVRR